MRLAVDLHIHSALSPCADDEMTPNNIVNMALLKGLDIIAVTDHNSVSNCEAVLSCAVDRDIIVVPGMELETMEEIHLVCLFPSIGAALKMQDIVFDALPKIKNREDIFGCQVLLDEKDVITGYVERLLLTAAMLGVEDVVHRVRNLGGAVIPAHVDRESFSIISNLGTVPENLNFKYLELSRQCDTEEFKRKNRFSSGYKLIKSSDAHTLGDILERESFIDLKEKNIHCLIEKLA